MNTFDEIVEHLNTRNEEIRRNDNDVCTLARRLANRVETRLAAPAGTVSWGVWNVDETFDNANFEFENNTYRFTMQCAFPVAESRHLIHSMVYAQVTAGHLRANVKGVSPVSIPLPVDIDDSNLQALAEHLLADVRNKISEILR